MFYLFSIVFLIFSYLEAKEPVKFFIFIPSYNNEKYIQQNIKSVVMQKYEDYRVFYVNDKSTDHTQELVEGLFENLPSDKYFLINNTVRKKALWNYYDVIHQYAHDEEVVVCLDGDDWFAHDKVLNILNEVYSQSKKEVWLTYGQYQNFSSGRTGNCTPIKRRFFKNNEVLVRSMPWTFSHLRTFYAWLFKMINRSDLMHNGQFYPMAWDLAIMFPLVEMAAERYQCINEVLYVYNDTNVISDWKVNQKLQEQLDEVIRKNKPYKRIYSAPKEITNLK